MEKKKILLFDIDGTLLLSGGAGKTALEKAILDLFGFENAWGSLVPDGKTDPAIIDEIMTPLCGNALSAEQHSQLRDLYHFHFESEIRTADQFRLMPGISQLLAELRNIPSLALGIATGNFKKAAEMKLRRGGLESYFDFGGFACDAVERPMLTRIGYERGKSFCGKNIDPQDVFVIGDTIYDVRAGKSLGARTISVCTGSTPRGTLEAMSPDYLFEDLSDIASFLSCLNAP